MELWPFKILVMAPEKQKNERKSSFLLITSKLLIILDYSNVWSAGETKHLSENKKNELAIVY